MLKDNQNLKDVSVNTGLSLMDAPIQYPKLNKLITALYMVTDMVDKNEPLRGKLRDLGAGIISDIYSSPAQSNKKIVEILSFLDIASAVGMISSMNCNILKKEFLGLQKSIQEYTKQTNPMWLEEFMSRPSSGGSQTPTSEIVSGETLPNNQSNKNESGEKNYKGHSTRIGLQKGSTLMNALNSVKMSDKESIPNKKPDQSSSSGVIDFNILKKQRREEIVKIIKEKGEATITDIRDKAKELPNTNVLTSCGEKTLQRELISMVKDNVLKKTGEKRWSKYFI